MNHYIIRSPGKEPGKADASMIQVTYRKKGIRITQVWYPKNLSSEKVKTDIVFYHGVDKEDNGKNRVSSVFHTLITNLTVTEDELQSKINKNVRYEIRRNKKENAEYKTFSSEELKKDSETVDAFAKMYELMYEEKGMKSVLNRIQISAYLDADAFFLTGIYADGKPVVFHSYIMGEKDVRLLHSVSDFRSSEADANFVARANKRLHFEDMLLWKNKGKERYDWGGVSSIETPNGIDAFKFKFGGEPLTYYNVYEGVSMIGKLAVRILKKRKGKM